MKGKLIYSLILISLTFFLLKNYLEYDPEYKYMTKADTEYIENGLCEFDANLQTQKPYRLQYDTNPLNGKYIHKLTFQTDEIFESYWHFEYFSPLVIGNKGDKVFNSNKKPQIYFTEESSKLGIEKGPHRHSYAYFSHEQIENIVSTPIVGKYPVEGKSQIIQISGESLPNKRGTHLESDGNSHAIDIEAELGSNVVSYSSGVVTAVQNNYNDNYICGKEHTSLYSNQILILQDDGFEAMYYHLQKGSVIVHVGERIEIGTPLAKIGCNNGCRAGSHLHFQVGGLTEEGVITVPIHFLQKNINEVWIPKLNDVVGNEALWKSNRLE